ncbi:DEAD/DEAH box helicase [Cupriavidus sp. LEh25]|uniref:DEAD/DEAH box helicase n=1 Tax=Cupriavidus consociatus TaxID=2821357 RepID=UPI001AE3F76E|nr:DEAD/DEAH box helicase [Cupriavidus sp. LEh25]
MVGACPATPVHFLVPLTTHSDPHAEPGQPGWEQALEALRALASAEPAAAREGGRRLLWALTLEPDGALATIEPLEQVRGARGWGKPKPVPLARVAEDDRLEPWDARIARAIRRDASHNRRYVLDRAAAAMALVGHPAVVLAHAPSQTLEVVEDAPALEAVHSAGRFVLRLYPPLREAPAMEALLPAAARQEAEALRQVTVLRDGPHRLKVLRFTPAQFDAARLIGEGLAIPEDGQTQLDRTLRALAGHFQVHADQAAGTRPVEAEARLRAEVAPIGGVAGRGITMRLVVTPLGQLGPRLAPGAGRERLMAAVRGETLVTQRDLDAELASLAEVFAALPVLVTQSPPGGEYTWTLDDPEDALTVLEALPGLPAVQAVEWPRGKEIRIVRADLPQLGVHIESRGAWYRLAGELRVAEGLVLELGKLIDWTGSHAGRFVPMGQGVYVALARALRGQLRDLASVAERIPDGIRVPQMATPWLDDVLAGAGVDPDAHFRQRIARLRAARDTPVTVPATLAAELRPYQEAGYRWAMTLAASGLGACLADDMGLGKTVQALAVLVARAAGGAALVIAPTSVCGNWAAEARRFAPTLNVHVYAEGADNARDTLLAQAGPHDLVIVSYTLLQQARKDFCARDWHTVVADEAQAFKNAVTRRAQAMFELRADFRMALSGTPVENRLAELWSVMRFCNPGLLGSLARFNEHFANPIERGGVREARQRLRRMIAPFVLRRTKAQVLDELPPRTELVIRVEPEAVEAAHYEALRRQAQTQAEAALARVEAARKATQGAPAGAKARALAQAQQQSQARIHVLAQIMRLRRAACDPRLATPEIGSQLGKGQEGAKLRAFVALASELAASGHKTLVFSQFVDFLQLLRQGLERAGLALQYLDGATPAAERTRRVAAFQAGEGDVFLISLKAGGFGLNLTAADYVIIADPWWNPAAEDQAMGRAHRIGQQRPVTVYRLINAGTIEERIVDLHRDKRALADGLLEADDESAAGTGAPLPDIDELVGLLRR